MRSPPRRGHSPPPARREPLAAEDEYVSPPPRRYDSPPPANGAYPPTRAPPSGPGYRNGAGSFPPAHASGPYRAPSGYAMSPPTGPAATPMSMSAHNRPSSMTPAMPGSGPYPPRGGMRGGHPYRESRGPPPHEYRDYPSGPPPVRHTSTSWSATGYRSSHPPPSPMSHGGPRGGPSPHDSSYHQPGPGSKPPHSYAPPFRGSSNSTSTTYPRTQRFSQGQPLSAPSKSSHPSEHPALSGMPDFIEGGKLEEKPYDDTRLRKLEEEAERLRKVIEEKQQRKRQSVREWDRLERESSTAGLRSELAEGSLKGLGGDEADTAAY